MLNIIAKQTLQISEHSNSIAANILKDNQVYKHCITLRYALSGSNFVIEIFQFKTYFSKSSYSFHLRNLYSLSIDA